MFLERKIMGACCSSCKSASGFKNKLPESRLKKVLRYANKDLLKKLVKEFGYSRQQAEALFLACKQFLVVSAENGGATPNQLIDIPWHEFILRTKDYEDYCRNYLGKFIHHCPTDGKADPEESRRKFAATRELATKRFGDSLSECWKR